LAGTASTISDAQLDGGKRSVSCTNDRARDPAGGHHRLDCPQALVVLLD